MKSNPIWWEKTIEYKFIIEAERTKQLQFAMPLSGVQERAGDGVFSSNSKIVLIEFKRSENELNTEYEKFENYDIAASALNSRDSHHFLIYGSLKKEGELHLHACTYFSRNRDTTALGTLECGLEPLAFISYLTDLASFKKVDGRSGGTFTPDSVASVIGVSSNGVSAISLHEYISIAIPDLYQTLTQIPPFPQQTPGIG